MAQTAVFLWLVDPTGRNLSCNLCDFQHVKYAFRRSNDEGFDKEIQFWKTVIGLTKEQKLCNVTLDVSELFLLWTKFLVAECYLDILWVDADAKSIFSRESLSELIDSLPPIWEKRGRDVTHYFDVFAWLMKRLDEKEEEGISISP